MKGNAIIYQDQLEMADYLYPNDKITLAEQRLIFQIRCEINPLPANKGNPGPCPMSDCQEMLNNPHIFQCLALKTKEIFDYHDLINGNLNQMKQGLQIWNENMEKLEDKLALDSVL